MNWIVTNMKWYLARQAGVAVVVDLTMVAVFTGYLIGARARPQG